MTFTLTESTRVSWLSSGSGTIAGVAFDDGLPGQAYPSPIVPSPPTRLSMSATADGGSATFSALTVTTDSLVPGGVILSGEASGVFDFTNGTSTAHCSTALITMRAVQ